MSYPDVRIFQGVTTRPVCGNLLIGVVSHSWKGEIILTADYEALGNTT